MALSNSNQDYNNCVANCKALFPNSEAALVACINGCAKVNSPADAGIFTDLATIETELRKKGRQQYCSEVRVAGKKALSQIPDERDLTKLDPISRTYIQRTSLFVQNAVRLPDTDDAALLQLIHDAAWVKLTADLAGAVIARMNDGGGTGGATCATRCRSEYDQCMSENDCSYSFFCLCCVPCSLQYGGCMARCVVGAGGFGGLVIA
jgi:hypothetical protein